MKLVRMFVFILFKLYFSVYRLHSQTVEDQHTAVWFRLLTDDGINQVISKLCDIDPVCTGTLQLLFPKHQHKKELSGIYEIAFTNTRLSDTALGCESITFHLIR
jgi:hypothetical protein